MTTPAGLEGFTADWWRPSIPPEVRPLFDDLVTKLRDAGLEDAHRVARATEVCATAWMIFIVDRGLRGESPRGDTLTNQEKRKLCTARRKLERERDELVASLGIEGWQ